MKITTTRLTTLADAVAVAAGFYEERAILLGGLGRHEQALAIYVHVLKDCSMAERYTTRTCLLLSVAADG